LNSAIPVADKIQGKAKKMVKGLTALAKVQQIAVSDAELKWPQRSLSVGKLIVHRPAMPLLRESDGSWMFESWLKPVVSIGGTQRAADAGAHGQLPSWRLKLLNFGLDGGAFAFDDRQQQHPVGIDFSDLNLNVKNVSSERQVSVPVQLSGRVRDREGVVGQLEFFGQVAPSPIVVSGQIKASQMPLHALEPYFSDMSNIQLRHALVGAELNLSFADGSEGPRWQAKGQLWADDLRADGKAAETKRQGIGTLNPTPILSAAQELLSWRSLSLKGVEAAGVPGQPMRLEVQETALSDFFARVQIDEKGRINLQDILKADADVSNTSPASPSPIIKFGPVSLANGRVLFSDHFIKPNYTADLSGLTGRLGAFSSLPSSDGVVQMADLALRGKAEGTATLEVSGKLNPLATPLALDIQGRVRDLELPPLSPYSVKYAGHGIERGKLSMDVAYRVQPDGQLTANNNIVLNQLRFGDAVEGAPASLPVRLAVALLADRNGVIDVNLPISGSLNDPQFSLGPVIFKVIVNLVVKAITAPFSLLAGALGGADQASAITFAPGSALLTAEARSQLDKLAQSLADKPTLKMTVVGVASLEAEQEAYRRVQLDSLLWSEKQRVEGLASGLLEPPESQSLTPQERSAALRSAYKRSKVAKPRNLVGLVKDVSENDMQATLLAQFSVTQDAMHALAVQRGTVVRDYLASKHLPMDRLFLGTPKMGVPGDGPDGASLARAELSLQAN